MAKMTMERGRGEVKRQTLGRGVISTTNNCLGQDANSSLQGGFTGYYSVLYSVFDRIPIGPIFVCFPSMTHLPRLHLLIGALGSCWPLKKAKKSYPHLCWRGRRNDVCLCISGVKSMYRGLLAQSTIYGLDSSVSELWVCTVLYQVPNIARCKDRFISRSVSTADTDDASELSEKRQIRGNGCHTKPVIP